MKKQSIYFIFSILLGFWGSAEALSSMPIILSLTVKDGVGIDTSAQKVFFEEHFKGHEQIEISITFPRLQAWLGKKDALYDAAFLQAVEENLPRLAGKKITILILNAHGGSFPRGEDKEKFTSFDALGEIHPDGLDETMGSITQRLRPYVSNDLLVIIHSCSALKGNLLNVHRRAQTLLDHLGAPAGTVYGSRGLMSLPGRCEFGPVIKMPAKGFISRFKFLSRYLVGKAHPSKGYLVRGAQASPEEAVEPLTYKELVRRLRDKELAQTSATSSGLSK